MKYLAPEEYEAFGLGAETADAAVTAASAMIDAHCRRPTLASASYTERLRVTRGSRSVRVSFGPLVSVASVKGRYAKPRAGEGFGLQHEVAAVFGLSGTWVDVDVSTVEVDNALGELSFAESALAPTFGEVEVAYTAGFSEVPDAVKVACAQIARNAQATPGLNVKSSRMDSLQMEYFSDSLLDSQVRALLRPFVAERLGA